jgi:hypothetical protein
MKVRRAKSGGRALSWARREEELRASLRKNLSLLLGEEVDEEEWLKLNAAGMEERLMPAGYPYLNWMPKPPRG